MNDTLPYDSQHLRHLAVELITNIRELGHAGWTPATSSNFSMRLDDKHAAITVSGRNKSKLTEADIMVVDFDGAAVGNQLRPSAETLLHTQLYKRFNEVGCVLHTHSITQTVASRLFASAGKIRFEGYELQKAFQGNTTHDDIMDVPVFANTQDMTVLAKQVEARLEEGPMWGYLIDGHGLYAWGRDMHEARRHLEAFEFLLACELKMREVNR
ncbi:methylthioribulose 1-phosphate dehydratase [Lysobacter sp. HDW10]|uniref:methylthioribulose 1-phosphate dehydratase n=1 Tax=Lysobacter sp. HDW10 TaxID=2714936 RepID=UPI00140E95C2|nr:methylthioribulose 1-phosphate dehydratase [Lysobacter sp. HDW10]QIK81839.1 methylthioribulose 1-phosphate dehydratase [Lysobacter sp. HDW10]